MSPRFIAEPPIPVPRGSLWRHLWQTLARLRFIVWQIVVPFKSRPEEIDSLPDPAGEVSDEHVKQCQWIFDQAKERRLHLEQKAQSTFALMVFLFPLLGSLFVFFIGRTSTSITAISIVAIGLLVFSAILLLLGFISAARAVGVKTIETLFINSVINEVGQFREYKRAFHARGLLYCAAMNEAMNDHIAQFVKGAQTLTVAAVVALVIAAVPTSIVLSSLSSSPTQTKIVGSVDVSSKDLIAVRDGVANLEQDIAKLLSSGGSTEAYLKSLEAKVAELEAKLNKIQKGMPVGPSADPGP